MCVLFFSFFLKFEKCSRCELLAWCRGCPAVASGKHGNFYAADPQCWKERKDDAAITDAFYGAPTVITLFASKDFLFSKEDCALAAENMMLAADSLGIGSCYIGPGWTAFAAPYGQEILRRWEIRTDYYAVMQLLLGYPRASDPHPTPKPRKNDRIVRF